MTTSTQSDCCRYERSYQQGTHSGAVGNAGSKHWLLVLRREGGARVSGPKGRGSSLQQIDKVNKAGRQNREELLQEMSGHSPARCRHRAGAGTGMCQASTKTEQGVTMSREGQAK